ncbi:hypothetical protein [Chryseobacterium viscerum]|uniref:DUF304 domain-containing protein n=1 Tax=Chryseobacterium viscerum TaxID=1037377 RepID=A0A316WDK4_9FLAO|nr:hypothetical protein [Chryseobacterium viscerum]PWN58403.1 hypothetical protein C1634_022890 [Chryseobacterium viscerum]
MMKIDNKNNIDKTVVLMIILIVLYIVFLLGMIMLEIQILLLYINRGVILLLLFWRFLLLRTINIEITEYILVIKYYHPILIKHRQPVLELPITEIYDIQLENSMMMSFFKITVNKRKKFKMFCYRLQGISKNQRTLLQDVINSVLDKKKT